MGKVHKVQAYYTEDIGKKPNAVLSRHFIHSKYSGGLWAEVRDLSQKEILAAARRRGGRKAVQPLHNDRVQP